MRVRLVLSALAVLAGAAACSADATESSEYRALEANLAAVETELADTQERLADMTVERDALAGATASSQDTDIDEACAEMAVARHSRSQATQERIIEIVADPEAFGTEDQVLDLLDQLAAPGTLFGDDAFGGATPWRSGWRNTLFGGLDATIQTWLRWLADDGSTGGALWTWSGTGPGGGDFDLIGISINTYDDGGRVTSQTAYYPYESSYVLEAFTASD